MGLTSVIDRSLSPSQIAVYQKLWSEDKLTVRTYMTRTVNAERPIEEIEALSCAPRPRHGLRRPDVAHGQPQDLPSTAES
ncbi:MAG: hypothetical protein R2724_17555 [Bryobacterales bacterium]